MLRSERLALCLVIALLPLAAVAQAGETSEKELDPEQIRSLREQAEKNSTLNEGTRARVVQLYDDALASLDTASARVAETNRLERERGGIGHMVDDLRAELEQLEQSPRLNLPRSPTVQQAEGSLARERARLAANLTALRDVEALTEERNNQRNETSRRLGALDQQLELLDDELRIATQSDTHPDEKRAAKPEPPED